MQKLTGDNWTLMHGDCRAAFLAAPAGSVHTIVTSPPYWGGVRDYGIGPSKWADGWEGCFGNEPTVEQYVAHTLEVFDALGHALREDGVIWWNIGSTYARNAVPKDEYVMRDDLTAEQRAYVLEELAKWQRSIEECVGGAEAEKDGKLPECAGPVE